jgi:hypothetical protein
MVQAITPEVFFQGADRPAEWNAVTAETNHFDGWAKDVSEMVLVASSRSVTFFMLWGFEKVGNRITTPK